MKDSIVMLEKILQEVKELDGQPLMFGFEAAVEEKIQELYDILF